VGPDGEGISVRISDDINFNVVDSAEQTSGIVAGWRRNVCWKTLTSLRRGQVTGSCSEVNDLIGWFLGEAFPAIDLAHGDLP
jgi:hypothetical protein